jgi:hypothetical protein
MKDSFIKNAVFNIFFKIQPSINDYFVNKINFYSSNFTSEKCNKSNCKICKYSITDSIIKNKLNVPLICPSSSSCNSSNCVYIITCTKCNVQYIGETGRKINLRLSEHIQRINYCIKYSENTLKMQNFLKNNTKSYILYKHFSKNHNLESDFRFQIFINNCIVFRLRLETDLMHLFNTVFPSGLNHSPSNNISSLVSYIR